MGIQDQAARSAGTQMTGTALVLGATLAWSFSGTFTRLLTTDVMTAIAWRSVFGGGILLIVLLCLHGRRAIDPFRRMGWPDALLVVAQVVCQASTVGALYSTTIANAAVIYATAPFMAAGLAFWLLGERMAPRTIFATLVAFAGVVVIVSSGFGSGHGNGDLLALLMTASFALIIVIPRAYPRTAMMPATIVSAAVTLLAFGPFGHPSAMPAQDWTVLAAFGFTNFTVAMYLFLAGARFIPAAQAALIGTLEIVLAPFWVWMFFGERPMWVTVVGGGMILAVVTWHTMREWQDGRQSGAGAGLS